MQQFFGLHDSQSSVLLRMGVHRARRSLLVATLKPSAQAVEIMVYGTRPLWSEIATSIQEWRKSGKPGRECYTFSIDRQGKQMVQISCDEGYTVASCEPTE